MGLGRGIDRMAGIFAARAPPQYQGQQAAGADNIPQPQRAHPAAGAPPDVEAGLGGAASRAAAFPRTINYNNYGHDYGTSYCIEGTAYHSNPVLGKGDFFIFLTGFTSFFFLFFYVKAITFWGVFFFFLPGHGNHLVGDIATQHGRQHFYCAALDERFWSAPAHYTQPGATDRAEMEVFAAIERHVLNLMAAI
jgi:hypothetical protein